jgi:hypothetical protein
MTTSLEEILSEAMSLEEAQERLNIPYEEEGRLISPFRLLGGRPSTPRAEIIEGYRARCAESASNLESESDTERISAEEQIRDYRAAYLIIKDYWDALDSTAAGSE